MTVLYRIQKLVEKDSRKISALWKVSVILICATCAVSGLVSYMAQGRLYEGFGGLCVLHSHLEFEEVPMNVAVTQAYEYDAFYEPASEHVLDEALDDNDTSINSDKKYRIDIHRSQWGPDALCQFCQYVPVMSILMGVFWATLFSACPKGGTDRLGLSQPWRIVPAAIFFFSIIAICSVLSSLRLEKGVQIFCKEFESMTNLTECTETIDQFTAHFHIDGEVRAVSGWTSSSVLSSWVSSGCWVLGVALLLVRFLMMVDFEISITTVTRRSSDGQSDAAAGDTLRRDAERSAATSLLRRGTAVTTV